MSYNKYPKEAVVSRILSGEEILSDISRETGININTFIVGEIEHRKLVCQQQ